MGLSMGTHFLLRPNAISISNSNSDTDTDTNSDTNFPLECSV
ncbi:hypothetical protein AB7M74_001802 [Bradyrhizobium japonicum]